MEYRDFNKREKIIYWTFRIIITLIMCIISYLIIDQVYTKFGDGGFIALVFIAGLGAYLQGIIKINSYH